MSADLTTEQVAPELHDHRWFASRIGMSADWVRRNTKSLPHHELGKGKTKRVRFSEHSVEAYLAQTAVRPDAMRRTEKSRGSRR